ncbi:MAG: CBS domain-containing protein [Hadesarchaea archaeon]|jgi:CBS domain-containing protein|nr:CBS domain-containing protein [Hadesarchaea archaeon]
MKTVPVREIMTENVVTCTPETNVAKAARLMTEKGVGCVVVTRNRKPIGILTEQDILTKVVSADLKASRIKVGEIMSKKLITIEADSDVLEAARIMTRNKIRRLPVVKGGVLAGILTASDIASFSPGMAEAIEHHEVLREEEVSRSVCERCGEVKEGLRQVNGMWLCEDCAESET